MSIHPAKSSQSLQVIELSSVRGRSVMVHKNLNHPGYWSVKDRKGKLLGHVRAIALHNVTMKIQQGGLLRCRVDKVKNVHAYIVGRVAFTLEQPVLTTASPITYNPYKEGCFMRPLTGKRVDAVRWAFCGDFMIATTC